MFLFSDLLKLINPNKYLQAIKSIERCLHNILIIAIKGNKQLNFLLNKFYFVLGK